MVLVLVLWLGTRELTKGVLGQPLTAELGVRSSLLVLAGLAASGPAVVGMWQVYARLRDVSAALLGRNRRWTPPKLLEELRGAWADAQRCLGALGVVVATAIVLNGAFRNTLLAAGFKEERLPASVVLVYGAIFTVLGLIVYVPLYLAWRSRVSAFMDRLYPLPADARPSEAWTSGRARLQTLLGADITLGKNLTAAAGILAPLVTSLLAVFIPKIT